MLVGLEDLNMDNNEKDESLGWAATGGAGSGATDVGA